VNSVNMACVSWSKLDSGLHKLYSADEPAINLLTSCGT